MITKLHIKEGVDRNFIVYDSDEKPETLSARVFNLLGEKASINNILIKTVYIPQYINIDIRDSYRANYSVYHDICLVQCRDLNYDGGYLLKYYKEDLKGNLPENKKVIIVGLSDQEEVILGAI